jgi:hypothetical protein
LVGNQIVAPATVDRAGDEPGANEGFIERNSDVDFWSFTSGSGSIASTAAAFVADNGTSSIDQSPRSSDRQNGTNLDIKMVLYDSSGTALATAAPTDAQAAIIIHSLPCSGTYYLSIEGDGWGDPTGGPTGWTSYGSIGQYFISGTVSVPNDPPTDIALSANIVPENQSAGTVIGSLSTTHPDVSDAHTYSLVSGTGDTHNAEFQISGSQLQTAQGLDFEAGTTRSVRIRTTDVQGATFDKVFTVNVTDVNDPPSVSITSPGAASVGIGSTATLVLDGTVSDNDGDSTTITWSRSVARARRILPAPAPLLPPCPSVPTAPMSSASPVTTAAPVAARTSPWWCPPTARRERRRPTPSSCTCPSMRAAVPPPPTAPPAMAPTMAPWSMAPAGCPVAAPVPVPFHSMVSMTW